MALFKIFNNFDNPSHTLPTSAHKGYCYFDVSTKLFWIDIKDGQNLQNVTDREYRVPLNAYAAEGAGLIANTYGTWEKVTDVELITWDQYESPLL